MKRLLFLSHRIPYPPNKGDKIRSFHELQFLARYFKLDLATLVDDHKDLQFLSRLEKICEKVAVFPLNPFFSRLRALCSLFSYWPLSVRYFYSPSLDNIVKYWLSVKRYSLIFCFSSQTAQYLPLNDIPFFMDFVDVDSEKWFQYSRRTKNPILKIFYRMEGIRLRRFEISVAKKARACIFSAQREANLFCRFFSDVNRVYTITNGVDFNYFSPFRHYSSPYPKNCFIILFSGAMDYYANIDGVLWFVKNVFPYVKSAIANVKFYIVGRNPSSKIKKLSDDPDIEVTGFVEDIRPFYAHAHICVAPLLVARGIQNKILEAMAMGKPVVCTPQAFEGIDASPDIDILVAKNSQDFATKILSLLENPLKSKNIGEQARKTVEIKYSWERNLSSILDLINAI